MRKLILSTLALIISCGGLVAEDNNDPAYAVGGGVVSRLQVGNFNIELVNGNGRCTLDYEDRSLDKPIRNSFDLGFGTPCEFVRLSRKDREPQTFAYGKGKDRRTVLLVTGGKPDRDAKDALQPNGCGTELAKIRIFKDRVELAWSGSNGSPICPSIPVDEVVFAS